MTREVTPLVSGWQFRKEKTAKFPEGEKTWHEVTLPHTWNAQDGQDGGNDYDRGRCRYRRTLQIEKNPKKEYWLEVTGAAVTSEVFLNGRKLSHHEDGFSTCRVNLTEHLSGGEDLLEITCDNGVSGSVYPQKADFTFYGGLYREVNLITAAKSHFALGDHGSSGILVRAEVSEDLSRAEVSVHALVEREDPAAASSVTFLLAGMEKTVPVDGEGAADASFVLSPVHLWDGRKDPFLYELEAVLSEGEEEMDRITTRFGCRRFAVDSEKGFLLNNRPYRLIGAARHQDRQGKGNAISRADMEEDMDLLLEMGATAVRLAHYQHDAYFYGLCDQMGLVVWAEIPYITAHMQGGVQNTLEQMTDLVLQNQNHPSIVCWCLSNEITGGGMSEDLVENHRALNELCHRLDPTRLTTMAEIFFLDPEDPLVTLPDIRSYNVYYGWYVGELSENDTFFDTFHKKHPGLAIGLSEYGADANPQYHAAVPRKGDYTEEYQVLYHEHMLKMWEERPYLWSMFCWNLCDFGADGRGEGGKPGQNQKGLVIFDRKIKKDAFYVYKAYLSDEPFVHICGRRRVDRTEAVTTIRVCTNLDEVTLCVDGREIETKKGSRVFSFEVPITGEHEIQAVARSGASLAQDRILIRHAEKENPDYLCPGSTVTNWFDKDAALAREGYYSILNTIGEIRRNPAANAVYEAKMAKLMEKIVAKYGDVVKSVKVSGQAEREREKLTVKESLQQAGGLVTADFVQEFNGALNQVPIQKAGPDTQVTEKANG